MALQNREEPGVSSAWLKGKYASIPRDDRLSRLSCGIVFHNGRNFLFESNGSNHKRLRRVSCTADSRRLLCRVLTHAISVRALRRQATVNSAACAAARRAIGTRNGEHDT